MTDAGCPGCQASPNISDLSALTVGPAGDIVLADNTRLRVYSIQAGLHSGDNGSTEVQDPATGDYYQFNR